MSAALVKENAASTSTSVTITAAASGNVLVLFTSSTRGAGARTVSSVSCTNVTWGRLTQVTVGSQNTEIWQGVVSGGSSGTTITITMSGTGATLISRVYEFSGVDTAINQDGVPSAGNGTGTSVSTNTLTTTVADSLVVACEAHLSGTAPTVSPSSPWTAGAFGANSTVIGLQAAYIAGSVPTGGYTATWTLSASVAWQEGIGAYQAAAVSGGGSPSPMLMLLGAG